MTELYHSYHTSPITCILPLLSSSTDYSTESETDISDHTIVTASSTELVVWELKDIEAGVNHKISTDHKGVINVCTNQS